MGYPDRLLEALEVLSLESCKRITDDDLQLLDRMFNLKTLKLPFIISDKGLVHLRNMQKLEELSLWNSKITDQAFLILRDLKSLKLLSIVNTKTTRKGAKELEKVNPNITIQMDGV